MGIDMKNSSIFLQNKFLLGPWVTSTLAVVLFLMTGCQFELSNTRASRQLRAPSAEASLQSGWRVYNDKCLSCHGVAATGSERAPDLLPVVRYMSSQQFVALVLKRYDLVTGKPLSLRDGYVLVREPGAVTQLGEPSVNMPVWQGDPAVTAHILDLYAYLLARADGRIGIGAPQDDRQTPALMSVQPAQ
jgi:hypothetical protein